MMRKLFAGDCLEILNDTSRIEDSSVDLIYLDPPFNSKTTYNLPFSKAMIKDQELKPVMAFKDTWSWSENEVEQLAKLREGDYQDEILASIVELVRNVYQEKGTGNSMGAYLINMAVRLKAIRRKLKDTGTIYLHCDWTASHYLKMLMDAIFGTDRFKNELVWCYSGGATPKKDYPRKHDVILRYTKTKSSKKVTFNTEYKPYKENTQQVGIHSTLSGEDNKIDLERGTPITDWWTDVRTVTGWSPERLGYPTQKPHSLMERIIRTSTNSGDLVLDPYCGCGTTVNAANDLGRQWIGIDISKFSIGLIRNRILNNFEELVNEDIQVFGSVSTIQDALDLAKNDKFEFEKWVCGEIGAEGMYHDPGTRGPDGGVDGVIPFYHSSGTLVDDTTPEKTYAIVQVKGGNVTVNDVKALSTTVRERNGKCGILVSFEKYKKTIENQREKRLIKDTMGDFPFIQGFTIEQLLRGESVNLPYFRRAA